MSTTTTRDVLDILQTQHQRIKELLTKVASGSGEQLEDDFCELRRMIAVHETAEEEIVYPTIRASGGDGAKVAKARTDEEAEGTSVLAKLEDLKTTSAEFQELFEDFRTAVLQHAEAEEATVFPILRRETEQKRQDMGKAFDLAEKAAPTHAHPHTGTSAAVKTITGPALAIMDHVRDAIRHK